MSETSREWHRFSDPNIECEHPSGTRCYRQGRKPPEYFIEPKGQTDTLTLAEISILCETDELLTSLRVMMDRDAVEGVGGRITSYVSEAEFRELLYEFSGGPSGGYRWSRLKKVGELWLYVEITGPGPLDHAKAMWERVIDSIRLKISRKPK